MKRAAFVAGAAGSIALAPPVARAATPLRISFFPGLDAWPLYVAHARGLFAAEGLEPTLAPTAGSVAQVARLMRGETDVASTAFDNLVAYDEGQGDPSVAGPFDLVAFLGGGEATNRLVARPEIGSYDALRGKTLAVDAVATGYSFVLRTMLARHGLGNGDYTLLPVGNTERRFAAMADGRAAAALVGTPFEFLGEQRGFRVLGDALTEVGGHYQGTCTIARRSWGERNCEAIAGYARAYRGAVRWLYAPANRPEALAILERATRIPADVLARSVPLLLDPRTGLAPESRFDPAGLATVLALRSTYAVPPKPLKPPAAYVVNWVGAAP